MFGCVWVWKVSMIKKYRQCTVTVCMFDICLCLSLSDGPLELFFGRSALWVSWESNKTDHGSVELNYDRAVYSFYVNMVCPHICPLHVCSFVLCTAVLLTGRLPYHRLSNLDAMRAISEGTKLQKPDGCNPAL